MPAMNHLSKHHVESIAEVAVLMTTNPMFLKTNMVALFNL
jgi:hypothetical protein